MKLIYGLFLIVSANALLSQTVVRGTVTGQENSTVLSQARLCFKGVVSYTAVTDSFGRYSILAEPGVYSLLIERDGYKSRVYNDLSVESGKPSVMDFELTESTIALDTIPVYSKKNKALILQNLQDYAAVFYDPARLVTSKAFAIHTDDQANHISVHGTTPNYIQWKIEGVEVVNPNHLENSGMFNDRPALNGGGVSILSAQLLQNVDFNSAPFDPLSGNSLTGIFDVRLRKGNELHAQRTIQASFLGTDICLEGPFSKKGKASYLVNLRYSTIGLLSAMGVNFGEERTNYKDASYVVNFPHRYGTIRFFGMAGSSETLYDGERDTTRLDIQKELHNLVYHSVTAINGINAVTNLSNSLYIKTVVAYSGKDINRKSTPASEWAVPEESDHYTQRKLSSVVYISKRLSNSYHLKAGSYLNYFSNGINSSSDTNSYAKGTLHDPVYQPFISAEGNFKNLEIRIGLHSLCLPRIRYAGIQPRLAVKYNFSSYHDLEFKYGISSQLQPAFLYLGNAANLHLKPTTSVAYSLEHRIDLHVIEIKSGIFYQTFKNVPVQPDHHFSGFNYFNEQVSFPLQETGEAYAYGYDLSLEKKYKRFYTIVSGSIFSTHYTTPYKRFKGRFDTGYNTALTAGKEWRLKNKKSFISAGIRGTARNGFRQASATMPENTFVYNEQLPVYKRLDLRLSYRKNRANSTVIWALDIQNVSNAKNVAYYYFDRVTQETETRYQLGLIPVLSYKILF